MARASKKASEEKKPEVVAKTKTSRKIAPVVAIADVGEKMLEQIVAATLDVTKGFIYTSALIHAPLIEAGLVEINPEMTNAAGEIATRATDKGVQTVNAAVDNTEVKSAEGVAEGVAAIKGFVLESDIPVPSITGRGRSGATTYPFEKMEVGHSFFVPNSADKPNAAKSLASTVSSATARFAVEKKDEAGNVVVRKTRKGNDVPEMIETRKFIVRSVEENGVKGARIWRIA